MNIVPLKNKTIDYVSKLYSDEVTFVLKIFDMAEYIYFKELAVKAVNAEGKELGKIYQELINMGVADVKGVKGKKLELEPRMYEDLSNELTRINQTTYANVKK